MAMPEYLSPGVYVEELPAGSRPIEGVSTSTAGFVGQTERGPTAPRLVTSWLDFQRWYGSKKEYAKSFLPYAVEGFFNNGGQRVFIARVVGKVAKTATKTFGVDNDPTVKISAIGPGEWGNRIFFRISPSSNKKGIRITLRYYKESGAADPDVVEDYDDLGGDRAGPRYFVTTVNSASQLVVLHDETGLPKPGQQPAFVALADGGEGDQAVGVADYLAGNETAPGKRTGLAALEGIDEISILCVPDEVHFTAGQDVDTLRGAIIGQCEKLRDRFGILQIEKDNGNIAELEPPPHDTHYAAVYYRWIRVSEAGSGTVLVPPGGHVAGIYARTDVERGVHKAPANEDVRGIVAVDLPGNLKPLEFIINKQEHDILNPKGINVIRDFRSGRRGLRVWGARTMSSNTEWRYVNVRRLFLFVEESIDKGTQWVVFEPNYESTWAKVNRSITNFLISVWRSGALAGVTQQEAFFVKCDRTTMTQDDIDNGRLICYIGIAPVKPAEFVIFRISQKTVEAAG
jgi:hypothetical protein